MACISFVLRFQHYFVRHWSTTAEFLKQLADQQHQEWLHVSALVLFSSNVSLLHCYDSPRLSKCLQLLKKSVPLQNFALRALTRASPITQIYYLSQVLQSAQPLSPYSKYTRPRFETDVYTYLLKAARSSDFMRNHLDWLCQVALHHQGEDKRKRPVDTSESICAALHAQLMEETRQNPSAQQSYVEENEFFTRINMLSASLVPHAPENPELIQKGLRDLAGNGSQVPSHLYLPTDPERKVLGLRTDTAVPLQSAKRVPLLINFETTDLEGGSTDTPCIFKVNDDVRNDQLCLQVVELMRDVFQGQSLPLYLRPYKVISTMTQLKGEYALGGILECIPRTKSRDEIGKEGSESLFAYFREKYGAVESQRFQTAKLDFIKSSAAYAVVSYILQIKDRHNGNILYDDAGHLLHIDFGFILSISPGGNMRFEKPDFKLTTEMIELMGGEDSESFQYFRELVVKGFLAVRDYSDDIMALVEGIAHAGLTCFTKDSLSELNRRFLMKKSPAVACKEMQDKINKANNSIFTNWYDRIQLMQQRIEY
jgi:phosphatidylinositol 4-kinase